MYRLVAYDLDGTLINKEQQIPESAFKAMRKLDENGVVNILTTGRSFYVVPKSLSECANLRYGVLSSGGRIYNYTNQNEEFHGIMSNGEAKAIADLVHEYNGSALAFFKNGVTYEKNILNTVRSRIVEMRRQEGVKDIYVVDDVIESLLILEGMEKMTIEYDHKYQKEIERKLNELGEYEIISQVLTMANVGDDGEKYVATEINRKGITKGFGLEKICKELNIDIKDTIAIGDSENDIPVMKKAGFSIAMGNGSIPAKESADFVTRDIDNDGILYAIDKVFGF